MFCFRCGASMADDAKVCPQCAAPVENAPVPPPSQPATPAQPAAWLNAPPAQVQYPPGQMYPQAQPFPGPAPTEGKATASLVLGILSILCFGVLTGIPAIILGHIARGNIRRSMGNLSGGGMALTGLILGYCSLAFSALFIAAILIPNVLRVKIKDNESAATSRLRTINTSQVTYNTLYPEKGYAPDLATLGPGQSGSCGSGGGTAEHACLIDGTLGHYSCTPGFWCIKDAYKYSMAVEGRCGEPAGSQGDSPQCSYVVVATPVTEAEGRKSFCSTSDAVIRQHFGTVAQPISAEECASWSPIL